MAYDTYQRQRKSTNTSKFGHSSTRYGPHSSQWELSRNNDHPTTVDGSKSGGPPWSTQRMSKTQAKLHRLEHLEGKDPDDCEVMRMAEFSRDAGGVMIVAEVAGPDVVGHRKSHDRRWQWQPRRRDPDDLVTNIGDGDLMAGSDGGAGRRSRGLSEGGEGGEGVDDGEGVKEGMPMSPVIFFVVRPPPSDVRKSRDREIARFIPNHPWPPSPIARRPSLGASIAPQIAKQKHRSLASFRKPSLPSFLPHAPNAPHPSHLPWHPVVVQGVRDAVVSSIDHVLGKLPTPLCTTFFYINSHPSHLYFTLECAQDKIVAARPYFAFFVSRLNHFIAALLNALHEIPVPRAFHFAASR
ncbi:hypothetical protein HU200_046695 [Digitaria exilis]|uniref:Uncharacterized protein n=1 Tax=Digitaria exilis TaxID=1010633 RepID=A0A835B410_9POAL|nr:hypothetical protein HU200_046695 [Digitaria exilis]